MTNTDTQMHRRAEAAAKAAEHVVYIEERVAELTTERDTARSRIDVLSQLNSDLEARNKSLGLELDYYKERCAQIIAKLRTAGNVILDAMTEPAANGHERYAPKSVEQRGLQAVAAGIDPVTVKAPKFLTKREGGE